MSEFSRELCAAADQVYGVKLERYIPGIENDDRFIAYCEHLAALDLDAIDYFLNSFTAAVKIIGKGDIDLRALGEMKPKTEWEIAEDNLQQVAQSLGLPKDFYVDKTPHEIRVQKNLSELQRAFARTFAPLIGKRGGAASPASAFRGFTIKLLARGVPDDFHNRPSFIAHIANQAGLECSRQLVASILKKGRT